MPGWGPHPRKMGLHRNLGQSLGNFPLLCFHSQEPAENPVQLLQSPAPARSCQKKPPNPAADERHVRKRPWQSSQRLHNATVQPNPPAQKSQFLHKSRQEELPQPRGGSTSILLLVAPGMGCGCVWEQGNGGKLQVPEVKAGKGSCPCQNPGSRGSTSTVPLNPARLRAGGLCHCCPTRNS